MWLFVNGFGGEAIGVDRNGATFTDGAEAADVVRMFVGDEDRVNIVKLPANRGEAVRDLATTQAGIDEHGSVLRFDEGAIAGAAAA